MMIDDNDNDEKIQLPNKCFYWDENINKTLGDKSLYFEADTFTWLIYY
jgi:hypothetical protein